MQTIANHGNSEIAAGLPAALRHSLRRSKHGLLYFVYFVYKLPHSFPKQFLKMLIFARTTVTK